MELKFFVRVTPHPNRPLENAELLVGFTEDDATEIMHTGYKPVDTAATSMVHDFTHLLVNILWHRIYDGDITGTILPRHDT